MYAVIIMMITDTQKEKARLITSIVSVVLTSLALILAITMKDI